MGKIIIRGHFPVQPGKAETCKAAVKALRERVLREDKGVLVYEFFMDAAQATLVVTEVYADEPSLISHIEASDFTGLFSNVELPGGKIQIHGNPSEQLRQTLGAFGQYELYLPIEPTE